MGEEGISGSHSPSTRLCGLQFLHGQLSARKEELAGLVHGERAPSVPIFRSDVKRRSPFHLTTSSRSNQCDIVRVRLQAVAGTCLSLSSRSSSSSVVPQTLTYLQRPPGVWAKSDLSTSTWSLCQVVCFECFLLSCRSVASESPRKQLFFWLQHCTAKCVFRVRGYES